MNKRYPLLILALTPALLGVKCGFDALDVSLPDRGRLSVRIADAPVDDAAGVTVQFNGVTITPKTGTPLEFDFATPRQIDLFQLQDGETEILLAEALLPAGEYKSITLKLSAETEGADSFIELTNGGTRPLNLPTDSRSGLTASLAFKIEDGNGAGLVIDFDLRRSVHEPATADGPYLLKPVLRLVDAATAGKIVGTVASSVFDNSGCPSAAVYIFSGSSATPNDAGSNSPPLTSARVLANASGEPRDFVAAFLPAGNYTAALTCEAEDDSPASDETIEFRASKNATVTAGEEFTVSF